LVGAASDNERPRRQSRRGLLVGAASDALACRFAAVNEFKPGLEGVVAFQTEIAEPDREGGALRYRGVDIEELVGSYHYEQVWGLLVDESFDPGMPDPEPYEPKHLSGNAPSDLQAETARLSSEWSLQKLVDISAEEVRDDLARLSPEMIAIVAESARLADGHRDRVPEDVVAQGETAAEKFLLRWRGEADPKHVKAIDTYWICTAEHGLNASTFTARIVASTGADTGAAMSAAVGALSGPLHGGAPARVLPMLDEVARTHDPEGYVRNLLERHQRIMGFGHRVYRAEDPRARLLRKTAQELESPRFEVAEQLERVALAALREYKPDRPLETNVEFWSAVVLDVAEIPHDLTPAMFACARVAGWSAHILEEKRTGRLIRPSAQYVGPAARPASAVDGAPVPT
jgi:citrate synthase